MDLPESVIVFNSKLIVERGLQFKGIPELFQQFFIEGIKGELVFALGGKKAGFFKNFYVLGNSALRIIEHFHKILVAGNIVHTLPVIFGAEVAH